MIYLDSCILIYALEDGGSRGELARARLAEAGSTTVAISPVVALECTVGPLRTGDLALRDAYVSAFEKFRMLPVSVETFLRAAELRASNTLSTPDAIHLAVAQLNGCTQFWTNDARLAKASHGLAVDLLH